MELNEYQELAKSTAIYPDFDSSSGVELSYLALGLTSEAGEFAGKVKKFIRDGDETSILGLFGQAGIKELGDVLWYVALAANALGVRLSTVAELNIEKLSRRKEAGTLGGSGDDR